MAETEAAAAVGETKAPEEAPKEEPKKEGEDDDNSTTLAAVKERLRFFFSDANVRQDAFVRKYLMENSKTIPVEVLLRFNTIKKYTESKDVVLQAAKELDSILTVQDDDNIGRVDPFTESKMNENIPVTLYLSNLPYKNKRYEHTTEDIKQLFGKEHSDAIVLVKFRFRNDNDKQGQENDDDLDLSKPQQQSGNNNNKRRTPLGACLVEFESLEALQKAHAHTLTSKDDGETVQPEHALHLGDHVVQVQLLKDYIESRKTKHNKRKQSDLAVAAEEEAAAAAPVQFELDWKPGCVIQIKGFDATTCDREAILEAVATELGVTLDKLKADHKIYADYSRGQTDGAIRFSEQPSDHDVIPKLCDKLNAGDLLVAGNKVESATILAGDEEKAYWDEFIAFKTKQMQQRADDRKQRRGGGGSGHKRGRRN